MKTVNRTIKFRAWDIQGKKMRQTHNIFIDSFHGEPYWQFGFDRPEIMNDIVLMQFTGLKDRNGKEIYEGDFIGVDKLLWRVSFGTSESGELGWLQNYKIIKSTDDIGGRYEVVGNIYENPELSVYCYENM